MLARSLARRHSSLLAASIARSFSASASASSSASAPAAAGGLQYLLHETRAEGKVRFRADLSRTIWLVSAGHILFSLRRSCLHSCLVAAHDSSSTNVLFLSAARHRMCC